MRQRLLQQAWQRTSDRTRRRGRQPELSRKAADKTAFHCSRDGSATGNRRFQLAQQAAKHTTTGATQHSAESTARSLAPSRIRRRRCVGYMTRNLIMDRFLLLRGNMLRDLRVLSKMLLYHVQYIIKHNVEF